MIEVKVITEQSAYCLEERVNDFIRNIPDTKLFDIKFSNSNSVTNGHSYDNYSAMIIYKR